MYLSVCAYMIFCSLPKLARVSYNNNLSYRFLWIVLRSQGYGLTESTAVGARGFNTKNLHNYSSVGLLAPNMEAKVVDFVSGVMKGPGSMGELWLRGPAIMPGKSAIILIH